MLNAVQTKLLIGIFVLLAGISSYLAYEKHQRDAEEQKINDAVHRLKAEAPKELPSGWAKSLKSK